MMMYVLYNNNNKYYYYYIQVTSVLPSRDAADLPSLTRSSVK